MLTNNTKCPICKSYQITSHYQLHVGLSDKNNTNHETRWTTKKFREQNKITPDTAQILIVPPIDLTWNSCIMCGTEFDDNEKIY